MNKTIALIDPFASASYLAEALHNVNTIALFTKNKQDIDDYLKVPERLFSKQYFLNNPSAEDIIQVLKPYSVDYIINGNELTTDLVDEVTASLLPSLANDPLTSHLRFDKYSMQEALKAAGLPHIKQQKISLSDLRRGLLDDSLDFPCFCKPLKGRGTIGAFKASDKSALTQGIDNVLLKKIVKESDEYLVQEYIEGQEFFIDAFSYQGQHYISSIQKYQRQLINGVPVLRYSEIVYDQKIWDRCADFVKRVLTATQLLNGFSHSEVFLTADNQLKLIEINPRISGGRGYCNKLAKALGLYSQVDLLLASFNNTIKESQPLDIRGFARRLYLFNWLNTPLKDPSSQLKEISTVHDYELLNPVGHINKSGEKYVTNIDLFVLMLSNESDRLEADSHRLFELEKSGLLL